MSRPAYLPSSPTPFNSGARRPQLSSCFLPDASVAAVTFMELQDVQELSNFFERRVSAYQIAGEGTVTLDEAF
jgi:ribonucleotide reductase alpha subunit